jgi:hypothetical protein
MSKKLDIDAEIRAANRLSREQAKELSVTRGEWELFAEIVEQPLEEPPAAPASAARKRFRRPTFTLPSLGVPRLAVLGAATVALALFALVSGTGGGPGEGPTRALGDNIQHLLDASPPIVFDGPGWRIFQYNEPFESEGTAEFEHLGPAQHEPYLEVSWTTLESPQQRINNVKGVPTKRLIREDREAGIPHPRRSIEEFTEERPTKELASVEVLDAKARVFTKHVEGSTYEAFAVWKLDGRTYQAYATTRSIKGYLQSLTRLRLVDHKTWEEALPPIRKFGKGIVGEASSGKGKK